MTARAALDVPALARHSHPPRVVTLSLQLLRAHAAVEIPRARIIVHVLIADGVHGCPDSHAVSMTVRAQALLLNHVEGDPPADTTFDMRQRMFQTTVIPARCTNALVWARHTQGRVISTH